MTFRRTSLPEDEVEGWCLDSSDAETLAGWLLAAAEGLDAQGAGGTAPRARRAAYRSLDELVVGQLQVHGSDVSDRAEPDEVATIVDVALPPEDAEPWVRLSFVGRDVTSFWLSAAAARETARGLLGAAYHLRKDPPTIRLDRYVGTVGAAATSGEAQAIDVEVEGAVLEPGWPRVTMYIGPTASEPPVCGGDSWYLTDQEARQIAEFLLEAAIAVAEGRPGDVGKLTSNSPYIPESEPWLAVTVQSAPGNGEAAALRVRLRLDDKLVRESGSDGALWFTSEEARRLAELLSSALEAAAAHPPDLYSVHEPREIVVADLHWD